jgi:hypothetical protein
MGDLNYRLPTSARSALRCRADERVVQSEHRTEKIFVVSARRRFFTDFPEKITDRRRKISAPEKISPIWPTFGTCFRELRGTPSRAGPFAPGLYHVDHALIHIRRQKVPLCWGTEGIVKIEAFADESDF